MESHSRGFNKRYQNQGPQGWNRQKKRARRPPQGQYAQQGAQTRNLSEAPQRSDDPDFTIKVRTMHRLLKAAHHLKNVSDKDNNPPGIQNITAYLATIIKPAAPSTRTSTLIDGNARSWAYTTVLILRQHYQDQMESEKRTLQDLGGNLLAPLEIATKWARRNLGRRLRPESVEEVQVFLMSDEEKDSQEPATPSSENGEPDERTSVLESSTQTMPPPHSQQHRGQSEDELSVYASSPYAPRGSVRSQSPLPAPPPSPPPPPPHRTTVATMTEPSRGDWSPAASNEERHSSRPLFPAVAAPPTPSPQARSTPQTPALPQRQRKSSSQEETYTQRTTGSSPSVVMESLPRPRGVTAEEQTIIDEFLAYEAMMRSHSLPAASSPPLLEPTPVALRRRMEKSTQRQLSFQQTTHPPLTAATATTPTGPDESPSSQGSTLGLAGGSTVKDTVWRVFKGAMTNVLAEGKMGRWPLRGST
ncbi:proteoglycan 4-like [Nothobranchius furzeri]|uniref:proteoglycan 4-like n=1 Tax=Nothobranchius furzeri TaxID=105023 RepID=UPI0039049CB0